ncbi:MAG TPA: substrate-binding domain-containing protein, partial [Roseiflexaceae bacterium]|nr:substrate-binding domain-containing protein [Roseiflexaceae bacterium]
MPERTVSPTIGLVLSEHLTNHYVGPLAQGAAAAAAACGARLILYSPLSIFMTRRDFTLAELPLLPRRVDAYLLPSNVSDEVVAACRGARARALTYAGVRAGLPSIGPDNRAGARAATAHLIGHGRRRIVHLAGLPDSDEAHERLAGYREALAAAGLPFDGALVAAGHFRVQEAEDAVARLLRDGVTFDAIFAANDLEARGALNVLARASRRVPEDIAIVGFDDSAGSDALDPPLTTVRQSAFQIGWDALRLLAETRGRDLPPRTLVPVRLVVRRSCGCPSYAAGADPTGDWTALAERLGQGQGPLVMPEQVAAWAAQLEETLGVGDGWQAALDAALEAAGRLGWHTPALRAYLDRWQAARLAAGHDPLATQARATAAKDRLAQALEERQVQERV